MPLGPRQCISCNRFIPPSFQSYSDSVGLLAHEVPLLLIAFNFGFFSHISLGSARLFFQVCSNSSSLPSHEASLYWCLERAG